MVTVNLEGLKGSFCCVNPVTHLLSWRNCCVSEDIHSHTCGSLSLHASSVLWMKCLLHTTLAGWGFALI